MILNGSRKIFHFFGDIHYSTDETCEEMLKIECSKFDTCYSLPIFLETIFDMSVQKNIRTDFFLETPYLTENRIREETNFGYMHIVYNYFKDCFRFDKKKCTYNPYVRIHYSDVRQANENVLSGFLSFNVEARNSLETLFYSIKYYLFRKRDLEDVKEIMERINIHLYKQKEWLNQLFQKIYNKQTLNDIFELYFNPNFKQNVTKMFEYLTPKDVEYSKLNEPFSKNFSNLLKLNKERETGDFHVTKHQLKELKKDEIVYHQEEMSDLIEDFLFQCFENIDTSVSLKNWNKTYKMLTKLYDSLLSSEDYQISLELLEQCSISLDNFVFNDNVGLDVHALITDGYILGRMFRKHKQLDTSDIVIVLAGEAHVDIYALFFESYLGLRSLNAEKGIKDYSRCLYAENLDRTLKIRK
jgi:hypothetical protein